MEYKTQKEAGSNTIEDLIKDCEFNPLQIGIEILKSHGYKVQTFQYSDGVYVYDSVDEEKILYWK